MDPYILYVEDDDIEIMKFVHTMNVDYPDVNVKIAKDGEQGMKILNENRAHLPKIIILDINMPKMNGLELLESIKDDVDFKAIPVIMLTTSDNEKDIKFSYSNQVAGYFVKPFDPKKYDEIIEIINQYWKQAVTLY